MNSAAISAWLTASHPNSEVKQVRAGVVLRWGTTREGPVLRFLLHLSLSASFPECFLSLARSTMCVRHLLLGVEVLLLEPPCSTLRCMLFRAFGTKLRMKATHSHHSVLFVAFHVGLVKRHHVPSPLWL